MTESLLHDQLEAAIKERLAVAQAALAVWPEPDFYASRPQWFAHINANGPDRVIRDCERDLKVLMRHGPARRLGGTHEICAHDWADSDGWLSMWPCAEIADLAEAYGIEAPSTSDGATP